MFKNIVVILGYSLYFFACTTKEKVVSLPGTFLESLSKDKFELLNPYLPDRAFYNSLGKEAPEIPESEIPGFLEQNNSRLRTGWNTIREKLKSGNINPSKLIIKETLLLQPPSSDTKVHGLVVVYEYKGKMFDDMIFMVGEASNKTYLLEIPNVQRMFSMEDTSLKFSKFARESMRGNDVDPDKMVKNRVDSILAFAKEDRLKEFTECMIYRGNNESRKWKSAMTTQDTAYEQRAGEWMSQIRDHLKDCSSYTFDQIKKEQESEGEWIIMPVKCGDKIIHLAFLKVNNQLLLGDID